MSVNIAIGIPAYNEEKNIYSLITSLMNQNEKYSRIKKIIVAIDGSTDNTKREVEKINDKRIQILADTKRKGKVKRLNEMYSRFKEDVFLQFDADIKINDKNLINKLVVPFIVDPKLGVVFGRLKPVEPKSFIGQMAQFGFESWEKAKKLSNKNIDRYNCFGPITAFSKTFIRSYRIPENKYVTEDTYGFYFAKKHQFKTFFQKQAVVFFKLPETLSDYTNQMSRYLSTDEDMTKIFGEVLTQKYETLSTYHKIQGLFKNLKISNMHIGICYIFLQLATKIQNILSKQKVEWVTITTSK